MVGSSFDFKAYATVLRFLRTKRIEKPNKFYSIKDIEKYMIRKTEHKCRQTRNYVSILQASGFLERTGVLPEKYRLREEMISI